MKKKFCVFTGSRAEYGLLKPLIDEIGGDPDLKLQLLVTGMHLSTEFGLTYKVIESDGYKADEKVEMLLSSDTPVAICKSMGLGIIGLSEALSRLKPDFLVVLGDRFETMTVAAAALVLRIPAAHIQGGELTLGAIDDAMRHSITKMSLLHFTYTEEYRRRVIQLGEHPERVFNVGALNSEVINGLKLLTKKQLEKKLGFNLEKKYIIVTFHSVTLEDNTAGKQFQALLGVIKDFPDIKVIFTKTNADTQGRIINYLIEEFVSRNNLRAIAFTSMGQLLYLSAMKYADVIVGNSSSGIIETPSFKVPCINIGEREEGRIKAANVIDCKPSRSSILMALRKALSSEFTQTLKDMENPYARENTARNIKDIIKNFDARNKFKKGFYDL